ncbi:MAG: RNA pseudouridine synthase [Treponema sp.]|jgi:23S rRNA pseudouridine1911/1915/1917 synthase|nr:RNA pseudouridine synthase [Treponema sp.]
MYTPYIVTETSSYAVLYKPPRLHSVPLKRNVASISLLDWYAEIFPKIREVKGKNPWEGGIVHRLDYETKGLVLAAKTQAFLHRILAQQEKGFFIKTYCAITKRVNGAALPGEFPVSVESAFRAVGPGGRVVKPILKPFPKNKDVCLDQGRYYCTEIIESMEREDGTVCFRLRIKRGFRHQIRSHLAWLGFPIMHDTLYGAPYYSSDQSGDLALTAEMLSFLDVHGEPIYITPEGC